MCAHDEAPGSARGVATVVRRMTGRGSGAWPGVVRARDRATMARGRPALRVV